MASREGRLVKLLIRSALVGSATARLVVAAMPKKSNLCGERDGRVEAVQEYGVA